MAAPASDWLRHLRLLLWKHWREFNETWQEARSQRPLPSLCFSGWSEKQDGRPGLWLAETFLTSPLKPLNGIQRNLTGSKISTSSTKFVFFGLIGKTRWPPRPLIGRDIFDFSSKTAERNSTKLDKKQDLSILYRVCVFSGRSVNKNVRLGRFLKKVAHCTQVHDMWPFGPLVKIALTKIIKSVILNIFQIPFWGHKIWAFCEYRWSSTCHLLGPINFKRLYSCKNRSTAAKVNLICNNSYYLK